MKGWRLRLTKFLSLGGHSTQDYTGYCNIVQSREGMTFTLPIRDGEAVATVRGLNLLEEGDSIWMLNESLSHILKISGDNDLELNLISDEQVRVGVGNHIFMINLISDTLPLKGVDVTITEENLPLREMLVWGKRIYGFTDYEDPYISYVRYDNRAYAIVPGSYKLGLMILDVSLPINRFSINKSQFIALSKFIQISNENVLYGEDNFSFKVVMREPEFTVSLWSMKFSLTGHIVDYLEIMNQKFAIKVDLLEMKRVCESGKFILSQPDQEIQINLNKDLLIFNLYAPEKGELNVKLSVINLNQGAFNLYVNFNAIYQSINRSNPSDGQFNLNFLEKIGALVIFDGVAYFLIAAQTIHLS